MCVYVYNNNNNNDDPYLILNIAECDVEYILLQRLNVNSLCNLVHINTSYTINNNNNNKITQLKV